MNSHTCKCCQEKELLDGLRLLIEAEKSRRLAADVWFRGDRFACSLDDRIAVLETANSAQAAIMSGVKPGDLRWNNRIRDFVWIDADDEPVKMDAYTFLAFARLFADSNQHVRLKAAQLRVQLRTEGPVPVLGRKVWGQVTNRPQS